MTALTINLGLDDAIYERFLVLAKVLGGESEAAKFLILAGLETHALYIAKAQKAFQELEKEIQLMRAEIKKEKEGKDA